MTYQNSVHDFKVIYMNYERHTSSNIGVPRIFPRGCFRYLMVPSARVNHGARGAEEQGGGAHSPIRPVFGTIKWYVTS